MLDKDGYFKPNKKLQTRYLISRLLYGFAFFGVVIGACVILILMYGNDTTDSFPLTFFKIIIYTLIGLWGLAIVFTIIGTILYYKSIEYQITEKGITISKGYFIRRIKNIPTKKIVGVKVYNNLFERIVKLFHIVVETAEENGEAVAEDKIEGITDYNAIYDFINDLIKKWKNF